MEDRSVAELVGPLLEAPGAVEQATRDAGLRLAEAGAVEIVESGPQRVTARMDDAGETREVELASTDEGLLAHCNCTIGYTGHICPHGFATAFVVWRRG